MTVTGFANKLLHIHLPNKSNVLLKCMSNLHAIEKLVSLFVLNKMTLIRNTVTEGFNVNPHCPKPYCLSDNDTCPYVVIGKFPGVWVHGWALFPPTHYMTWRIS